MLMLGSNFMHQYLPGGDVVIYSPEGSATPFVLTDKALSLFNELLSVSPISVEDFYSHIRGLELSQSGIETVLEEFKRENIIENDTNANHKEHSHSSQTARLLTFWMHLTDSCNLRCDYCYIVKGSRTMSEETIQTFLSILERECSEKPPKAVHLKFAGGEPLLRSSLMKSIIERTKAALGSLGIRSRFSVITNGTMITDDACEMIKDAGVRVSVSLDGLGSYNSARRYPNGKESVEEVIRGIERLAKHNISPYILTVVSNTNVFGLDQLISYSIENSLGVDLILCRDIDEKSGELVLDLELMDRVLLPTLRKWVRMPLDQLPRLSISTLNLKGKRPRPCAAGRTYLSVGPDGEIGSCQMTLEEPLIPRLSPEDRLGEIFSLHRAKMRPAECDSCIWRYACAGGCEVLARKCSIYIGNAPLCAIIKPILGELLILEGRKIQRRRKEKIDGS